MSASTAITVVFTAAYLLFSLYLCRGVKLTTRGVTMTALACALTMVLSYIYIPLPTGASITCASMLPLMVLALGWQLVHWGQFFVEHMVCFSCLGYAGVWGGSSRLRVLAGSLLASVLKVTGHILSGVLFFSQNAWDGWGAWGYSLTYNLTSNIPECILSMAVLLVLPLGLLEKTIKGGERA